MGSGLSAVSLKESINRPGRKKEAWNRIGNEAALPECLKLCSWGVSLTLCFETCRMDRVWIEFGLYFSPKLKCLMDPLLTPPAWIASTARGSDGFLAFLVAQRSPKIIMMLAVSR